MSEKMQQALDATIPLPLTNSQRLVDKQILALDALSKLTKQFADKQDFGHLVNVLLLTICGQFSVPNSFATIRRLRSGYDRTHFFATGKYKDYSSLATWGDSDDENAYFLANRQTLRVQDLDLADPSAIFAFTLHECGVKLITPLFHRDRLIGIIGLGEKVNHQPFDDAEVDLLGVLLSTVSPLIANSFLYTEISILKTWYLEILNSVKQAVFVFGRNNRLKKVNTPGLDILQTLCSFEPDQQSLNDLTLKQVFPDSVFKGLAQRVIRRKDEMYHEVVENVLARGNGIEKIYIVSLSTINHISQAENDLIVTLDDVTIQKENERRLFDLEKFAEKGMVVSSISHELSNFLTMMLGGVELTELAVADGDTNKARDSLEKLKQSIQKMVRFTTGLTDYTQFQAKKTRVNLNSVVADVLSFAAVQGKFKKINTRCELDTRMSEFEADADQIAQLVLNLLNNAADAILEAKRETGQIVVKTWQEGESWIFSIADNGVGMTPEIKTKLFKERLTTKEKGHGYGLLTCAKIVENHGGRIEVESEVDKGTTIILTLPRPHPEHTSQFHSQADFSQ